MDVAFGIEAHPIDAPLGTPVVLAELMQHGIAAQGTVGQNVVGPELAEFRTGLDDVEGLLIRREQEAVGPGRLRGSCVSTGGGGEQQSPLRQQAGRE